MQQADPNSMLERVRRDLKKICIALKLNVGETHGLDYTTLIWANLDKILKDRAILAARLEQFEEWSIRIAGDERVCGWVYQQDYGLYRLLADPDVYTDATEALKRTKELPSLNDL